MIQAETPQNLVKDTVVKVHGFAAPINQSTPSNQSAPINQSAPTNQKINPHKETDLSELFYHWWHKIAVILLTFHGLFGIWESIKFIAVDFRELENKLELHQIQVEEVNQVISMAVVVAGITLVNLFMAVRLSKIRENKAHNIDLLISTILIIGTKYIQEILIQFDLLNIFTSYF